MEFLPRHDAEDRAVVTEAIGHMLAYAQMTDTRMVALLGDPEADAYELLFSFNSPKNKAKFLRLLRTSEVTSTEGELILIPVFGVFAVRRRRQLFQIAVQRVRQRLPQ